VSYTLYQYPACSTCRKAVKSLEAQGRSFTSIHLKESPPDVATLRDLWQRSGLPLRKFFNTSGQSYRGGNWKELLKNATEDEALAGLAADGMLIKRPILDTGTTVLVGFREDDYGALS
jgi:arsenate reductase